MEDSSLLSDLPTYSVKNVCSITVSARGFRKDAHKHFEAADKLPETGAAENYLYVERQCGFSAAACVDTAPHHSLGEEIQRPECLDSQSFVTYLSSVLTTQTEVCFPFR